MVAAWLQPATASGGGLKNRRLRRFFGRGWALTKPAPAAHETPLAAFREGAWLYQRPR